MSLLGEHSAVVSLGTSCQTASQIRLNWRLLSDRLGDTLHARSFPLDWMFAPPAAAARLLRSDVRVPTGAAELVAAERPFWPRHGVWLWHDPEAAPEDFPAMQARMTRRWDRLLSLRTLRRRIFVVSNTQNNLPRVAGFAPQPLDFRLTAERMRAVVQATQALVGAAGTSFLFVAYADRITADAREAGLPLAILQPDGSDHGGDDAQWTRVLGEHIG